jgi:hypothetical protein
MEYERNTKFEAVSRKSFVFLRAGRIEPATSSLGN